MDAINEVDFVYTEVKLDSDTLYRAELYMQNEFFLEDILPEGLIDRLDSYLASKEGYSLELIHGYKIWAVALSLIQFEFPDYYKPISQYDRLDQYIWNIANEIGKETSSLETYEEQLGIFNNLSYDEQVQLLNDSLIDIVESPDEIRNQIDNLITYYLTGNLKGFQEIDYQSYDIVDPLYDKLITQILTERNYKMAHRISAYINNTPDKQFFFTIGASHYYGDEGLITLLEEKYNYTITRVSFNECSDCVCGEDETVINNRCYYPFNTLYSS